MLSFASHQLSERQVWALGRLASRVGMRFEVSTLSGPDCSQCQTYNGFNHRQGEKTEKRSSSQDTHARAVGSAAALAIDADDATSVARLANLIFDSPCRARPAR
jgi:hypothetical protein